MANEMNGLGLSPTELHEYLSQGLVGYRPPDVKPRSDYWRKRRQALQARGLTVTGTPRKRAWMSLKGLTPEQRKARTRRQQRESRSRRANA